MSTSEDSAAAAALAFRHVCAGIVSSGQYLNCVVLKTMKLSYFSVYFCTKMNVTVATV